MYEKIQPLLENLHRNFTETQNNISKQRVRRAAQAGLLDAILALLLSCPAHWGPGVQELP